MMTRRDLLLHKRTSPLQDEVLTISEKVVVRVHDLVTWLSPTLEWSWGREVSYPTSPTSSPETSPLRYEMPQPQVLTDPGIDFSDVNKQQKEYESSLNSSKMPDRDFQTKVVVLSYPRYCRYRALLRRLEGAEPSWLGSAVAAALGGFTAPPGTRVLFCRDTFDYPDLETHELLCNHLGMYDRRSPSFGLNSIATRFASRALQAYSLRFIRLCRINRAFFDTRTALT